MFEVKRGNRILGKILARRGWDKADAMAAAKQKFGGGVNVTRIV